MKVYLSTKLLYHLVLGYTNQCVFRQDGRFLWRYWRGVSPVIFLNMR